MVDAARWPKPEDAEPGHPVHKDRLTYCRACGGSGQKQGHRTRGICDVCAGFGKTSTSSTGKRIRWTRKGWILVNP